MLMDKHSLYNKPLDHAAGLIEMCRQMTKLPCSVFATGYCIYQSLHTHSRSGNSILLWARGAGRPSKANGY